MSDDPAQRGAANAFGRFAARARQAAQSLKDEYEAGKRGDDGPADPIWATPAEQLDAAVRLVRSAADRVTATASAADEGAAADRSAADRNGPGQDPAGTVAGDGGDDAVGEVAEAMRGVDWAVVRAATRDKAGDAGRAARTLAAQVDWARVQPTAQRVSTALIGAVASGQLGVGGPLGPLVARAIVDQGGFGGRVQHQLAADDHPLHTGLDEIIDTTGREIPGAGTPGET